MCGLLGMVGKDIQKVDREMFSDLLWVSGLRGPHSTGLLTAVPLEDDDMVKMRKLAVPSPNFVQIDQNNGIKLLESPYAQLFMGHCRWATVGAVTAGNAHPFNTGRYISAHNGTLHDHWSWGKKGTEDEDKTDSLLMFERMEREGVKEVLEDILPSSAYAVSIYDTKTRKVILARNKRRSLYVGMNKERNNMCWASEDGMIEFAAGRAGIKMDVLAIPEQYMFTINIDEVSTKEESPWDVEKVEEKTYFTSVRVYAEDSTSGTGTATNFDTDWMGDKNEADPYSTWVDEYCAACENLLTSKEMLHSVPVEVVERSGATSKYYVCDDCTQKAMKEVQEEIKKTSAKKDIPANVNQVSITGEVVMN